MDGHPSWTMTVARMRRHDRTGHREVAITADASRSGRTRAINSAAHAGLRLREGGLQLLGASAVDMGHRLAYRAGQRRVHGLGLRAVVDRDDASRTGRQGGAHLLPESALDPVLGELPDQPTGSGS